MAENLSGSDQPPPPPLPDPPEQLRSENTESELRLEEGDSPDQRMPAERSVPLEDPAVPQPRLPEESPELQAQATEQELGTETAQLGENVAEAPEETVEEDGSSKRPAETQRRERPPMKLASSDSAEQVIDEPPTLQAQPALSAAEAAEDRANRGATDTAEEMDQRKLERSPEEATELQDLASLQELGPSVPNNALDLPGSVETIDNRDAPRGDPDLSGWQDRGRPVATEYASVADRKLVDQPTVDTAKQGQIGDCSLIASMGAISNVDPDHWGSHIRDDGDTAAVTFYRDGVPTAVTVEKTVPIAASGHEVGATTTDGTSFAPLVEKAYVQEFAQNDYGVLNRGVWPHDTLSSLTGREGQHGSPGSVGAEGVRQLVNDGVPVVAASRPTSNLSSEGQAERGRGADQAPVVSGHAYAIRSIADDGSVQLNNPWGFDHLNLTWKQFDRQFNYLGWS